MFTDHEKEQQLYHAIATVGTLLLQIGEVGKQFRNRHSDLGPGIDSGAGTPDSEYLSNSMELSADKVPGEKEPIPPSDNMVTSQKNESNNTNKDHPVSEENRASMEDAEDGAAASATAAEWQTTDAGDTRATGVDDKLLIVDDWYGSQGDTVGGAQNANATEKEDATSVSNISSSQSSQSLSHTRSSGAQPDLDWSVSFEQFLASMLTEPALVEFFECQTDVCSAVDRFRNKRFVDRWSSSVAGSPPS